MYGVLYALVTYAVRKGHMSQTLALFGMAMCVIVMGILLNVLVAISQRRQSTAQISDTDAVTGMFMLNQLLLAAIFGVLSVFFILLSVLF